MGLAPDALAAIWAQHRDTMYARVDMIAAALLDGSKRPAAREAAHQLAGTVGSFGFPRASDVARALEQMLAEGAADLGRMGELVGELRADLDDPPFVVTTTTPAPPPKPPALPLVLLATSDRRETERLRVEAGRRGLSVGHAERLAEVGERALRDRPDVLVLDLGRMAYEHAPLVERLSAEHPSTPVLVLAEAPDFASRRVVARSGASGLLDRASTPAEIMDQVALALQRRTGHNARVLLVGEHAEALSALTAAGLEVEVAADPAFVWEDLQRVSPSLVVIGSDVGRLTTHELCRVLRNAPRWSVVPVVMLPGGAAEAFAAGADDHVAAEAVAIQLPVRVRSHLERFRLHQALAETDALTGLQNRRTASAAISGLIRMAERLDKPLSLVEIDIDHFKAVNDQRGHIAGDAVLRRLGDVLRRSFRGEDVLARWGGEEFVVALFGLDRERGMDRLAELQRVFRAERFTGDFSVTFSAGVAAYPTDGADLETLYIAADEALYAAKAAGRDQVVGAGGTQKTQQVDIAIVEDEDAASELMSHFLTERGHRCWRFSNGAGAASMLAGDVPKVRARVILLDLNMPALDGVELLGLLKRDSILAGTKVIVVSARADDDSRVRTVILGASDYLTKPLDFDALARSVDRALGRS